MDQSHKTGPYLPDQAAFAANDILREFDHFYEQFLEVPELAKLAFEQRNHANSIKLSSTRLQLYSLSIKQMSEKFHQLLPELAANDSLWQQVEQSYRKLIANRYDEDLALAYFHSVRRKIYSSEWRAEDYSILKQTDLTVKNRHEFIVEYKVTNPLNIELIIKILRLECFSVEFGNINNDAEKILKRLNQKFHLHQAGAGSIRTIEMFKAGFYRNRGAYLVGRINCGNEKYWPFIIALLNNKNGIYVDALITSTTFAHNMFSSTLANFHVSSDYYHELCLFLKSIMPMRPLGLHYSTVGYNHLGKVAVMHEIENEITSNDEQLQTAVGMKGTVAIGFSTTNGSYCLKVIRNKPTKDYKWGEFEGVNSVLAKYRRVHEINRTDSMLDSIIYYDLRLAKDWFAAELLEELLEFASGSIVDDSDSIIFKYLIVQRKLTPLPVYLENATDKQAEQAIINLGYCIKNNLAANIFNKDLDIRNYGITGYSKVYLFDYDALEKLTDVKIRTNVGRFDGEEDIPEWFFESGVIFLPEEIVTGLCLPYRHLRNLFSDWHNELLSIQFWENIQQELLNGVVPSISVYPDTVKLH